MSLEMNQLVTVYVYVFTALIQRISEFAPRAQHFLYWPNLDGIFVNFLPLGSNFRSQPKFRTEEAFRIRIDTCSKPKPQMSSNKRFKITSSCMTENLNKQHCYIVLGITVK